MGETQCYNCNSIEKATFSSSARMKKRLKLVVGHASRMVRSKKGRVGGSVSVTRHRMIELRVQMRPGHRI